MQYDASSSGTTGQPLRDAQQPIESLSGRCSGPAGPQQTAADGSALSAQMASVRIMPPNSTRTSPSPGSSPLGSTNDEQDVQLKIQARARARYACCWVAWSVLKPFVLIKLNQSAAAC